MSNTNTIQIRDDDNAPLYPYTHASLVLDGIESVTSQQDGTVVLNKVGGNSVIIDLNHTHSSYLKYVLCANEAAYNAITTKDPTTLYLIPES